MLNKIYQLLFRSLRQRHTNNRLEQFSKLVTLGDAARASLRWNEAATFYRAALTILPNAESIWVQLGHALKELGRLDESQAAYHRALDLDPSNADTLLNIGHLHKVAGRVEEAKLFYLQAFRQDPKNTSIIHEVLNLADCGDAEAIQCLRQMTAVLNEPATGSTMFFEVTDLVDHLGSGRRMTGIQRVQVSVISALLNSSATSMKPRLCRFDATHGCWRAVSVSGFNQLCDLASNATGVPEARAVRWDAGIENVYAPVIEFSSEHILVNLGTSWSCWGYIQEIERLKIAFGVKYYVFIHDLVPLFAAEFHTRRLSQQFLTWIIGVIQLSDGFIVNSRATILDLRRAVELLGHDISEKPLAHIPLDAAFECQHPNIDGTHVLSRIGVTKECYVLFVSTFEPRKNHRLAMETWLHLAQTENNAVPRLVCVGQKGWMFDDTLRWLRDQPVLEGLVILSTGLSDHELHHLYENCLFTIYPSTYEGWGLPITESIAHGRTPVVANTSAMREAAGECGEYFDPKIEGDFEAAVTRLLNAVYRNSKRAQISEKVRTRTWEEIAIELERYLLAWQSIPQKADCLNRKIELRKYYPLSHSVESDPSEGLVPGVHLLWGGGWAGSVGDAAVFSESNAKLRVQLPTTDPTRIMLGLRNSGDGVCEYRIEGERQAWVVGVLGPGAEKWVWWDIAPPLEGTVEIGLLSERIGATESQPAFGVVGLIAYPSADTTLHQSVALAAAHEGLSSFTGRHYSQGVPFEAKLNVDLVLGSRDSAGTKTRV